MIKVKHVLALFTIMFFIAGCKKDNPFNPGDGAQADSLSITTFAGLHQHFLEPKCANPACHDGAFEPDFRTVESAYNTMVYQPVTKNDDSASYTYRVVPGSVDDSWLMNRLMTDDDTLGQMPLYAVPLTQEELGYFQDWVIDSARDAFGLVPIRPNRSPEVKWYTAYEGNTPYVNRIDTNRINGWSSAMQVPHNQDITLLFRLADDLTDVANLSDHKFFYSNNIDYSNASMITPVFYSGNYYTVSIPANTLTQTQQYWFYYHVQDDVNSTDFPNTESKSWWIAHFSLLAL
ncbi:MAG: hypothetical protein HOE88_04635 [Flavobacteriales bacterium]|jgi:hypothetical protein|nr:hypothetical protein [Flavobacteriales bacterium]MBT3677636.1 hypothetical protein [Flavobacteriales bacterium]MBT3739430.1 hypothetical protein [Flavobacteriales bacterium]MBT4102645.1 hypothetical protein [Flavobacteriales bacterium]MBT4528827.1 hypothetical protein [Flavobacteriales bacterium]